MHVSDFDAWSKSCDSPPKCTERARYVSGGDWEAENVATDCTCLVGGRASSMQTETSNGGPCGHWRAYSPANLVEMTCQICPIGI